MRQNTFLGFGFGAIQAGLFLAEAQASGNFERLVVVYRRAEVIEAIRKNGGYFFVNIAHKDRIEEIKIGPIDIYNVNDLGDRKKIVTAVAEAGEINTSLSSTDDYVSNQENSIHKLLATGLKEKIEKDLPSAIIYTAENDNAAAQKLGDAIALELDEENKSSFNKKIQIINTVIGKMSISIRDAAEVEQRGLRGITPGFPQAFLVEEFSHILIEKVRHGFERGIRSFIEKDDLLPFEEAKLYGHNAIHAVAAYLAMHKGLQYIKDLESHLDVLELLNDAFMLEVGAALIRKYAGVDEMFNKVGFKLYADNLVERMLNPFLLDTAERVGRDIERKLGWDDRLVGAMRMCLGQGVEPRRLALGVAAALKTENKADDYRNYLESIWGSGVNKEQKMAILRLVEKAILN